MSELPNAKFDIVRMKDPNLASTMAEAVLAWTLYLHRDMPKYHLQQKRKVWKQNDLVERKNRHIGVLGLGNLGRASVEKLLLNGFNVSGWSRNQAHIEGVKCFYGRGGLEDILPRTDILISLLPLTSETRGLLNFKRLGFLPRGASLINFSRGPIVEETALLQHIEHGHIEHAVLDVFDIEPLPPTNALWDSPNVTILPHISAPTNIQSASKLAAKNIMEYFKTGEVPEAIVRTRGY